MAALLVQGRTTGVERRAACVRTGPRAGAGARDAFEGKGPQRRPQRRLDRRLEAVAEAVGGGYCRLHMPLKPALGVRETVAGHRLGAPEGGGGGYLPPFQCIPDWGMQTHGPTLMPPPRVTSRPVHGAPGGLKSPPRRHSTASGPPPVCRWCWSVFLSPERSVSRRGTETPSPPRTIQSPALPPHPPTQGGAGTTLSMAVQPRFSLRARNDCMVHLQTSVAGSF